MKRAGTKRKFENKKQNKGLSCVMHQNGAVSGLAWTLALERRSPTPWGGTALAYILHATRLVHDSRMVCYPTTANHARHFSSRIYTHRAHCGHQKRWRRLCELDGILFKFQTWIQFLVLWEEVWEKQVKKKKKKKFSIEEWLTCDATRRTTGVGLDAGLVQHTKSSDAGDRTSPAGANIVHRLLQPTPSNSLAVICGRSQLGGQKGTTWMAGNSIASENIEKKERM